MRERGISFLFSLPVGIDTITTTNVLHQKEVISKIPLYFQNQSILIVFYNYIKIIAPRVFNNEKKLHDLDLEQYIKKPLTCDCSIWPYINSASGHVIIEDLNMIQHLRKVISGGPKFREAQHINWNHNFKIIMNTIEDYARTWTKREEFVLENHK